MASYTLRPAVLADALEIAGVHRAAVQALAGGPYVQDVLDRWAPPVVLHRAENLFRQEQDDGAVTLVAEAAGDVVGFAIAAPHEGELRACYVAPEATGQGIGRALVAAVEKLSHEAGCMTFAVRAPLNAVRFYANLDYAQTRRAVFAFDDGIEMPVVLMAKTL